jgi:hypothetical protein
MKIAFYLNSGRKKNLYCRISDKQERITLSLDYTVSPENWDPHTEMPGEEDMHYYTLRSFKDHLSRKYHELMLASKGSVLNMLKNEADTLMAGEGLDGIAKTLFNQHGKVLGVPAYEEFVQAFEKYSGLKRSDFRIEPLGELIHFHTDDEVFEMDTYAGKCARLKAYVERNSYDEINVMTEESIWREIYGDTGIEKHKFLPVMLSQWEIYWSDLYVRIREEIGRTAHLDEMKAQSWRGVQVFMECYEGAGNIIELASDIDDMKLYPMAIITMLDIFDADVCYEEYCEYEFSGEEWESVILGDDEDDSYDGPFFYVKTYEV